MQAHARTCLSPKLTQNPNFFRGEDRNDSQSGYGNPKTPDFFEGNIRTFKAKHRNFPSKKSDVFDFRKGPAFRHSTRLQIRGAKRRKHHQPQNLYQQKAVRREWCEKLGRKTCWTGLKKTLPIFFIHSN